MRAMVLTGHGDFDKLVYHDDWPTPSVGAGEVLIKVHACGLNNTDVNTRTAWYSKGVSDQTTGGAFEGADDDDASWGGLSLTFPRIQGADVAGTVVDAASDIDQSIVGKRVLVDTWLRDWDNPLQLEGCGYFGSECDGGFADYVAIDARHAHPIESSLTDVELATFATACITAENMLNRAEVKAGDSVLIPGASGGVGSALVQLAKRRGAKVIGLASEAKHDEVLAVGADTVLARNPSDLKAMLKGATGRDTVDVVADVVGGADWAQLIEALERGGRYTCAGAIAGPMVEMDLRTFYLRDLTFTGATVVPPGVFADLVGYIERGEIKPVVGGVWPLKELVEAQEAFIAKKHIGNLVVTLD